VPPTICLTTPLCRSMQGRNWECRRDDEGGILDGGLEGGEGGEGGVGVKGRKESKKRKRRLTVEV
jgi:hypothetical protein